MNFDKLCRENYPVIYKYLSKFVNNKTTLEDMVQETFTLAFQKRENITSENFTKYVHSIARNLCIDYYYRVKSYDFHPEKMISFSILEEVLTIEDKYFPEEVELTINQMNLEKALKEITAPGAYKDQYKVLLLRTYGTDDINDIRNPDNKPFESYDEISEYLSIPAATCRSRYTRICNKLKEILQ